MTLLMAFLQQKQQSTMPKIKITRKTRVVTRCVTAQRNDTALSPTSRKLKQVLQKKERLSTLEAAINEIKELRLIKRHGVIAAVIRKYNKLGYNFITRGTVGDFFAQEKNRDKEKPEQPVTQQESPPHTYVVDASAEVTVDSSLTDDYDHDSKRAGRPKGTTDIAKSDKLLRLSTALTKAAILFAEQRSIAHQSKEIVAKGVLAGIACSVEEEFELESGQLNLSTIKKRVDRNNLTGVAYQKVSPLDEIEPLLVEYCIRLADMGAPITRDQLICLADSILDRSGSRVRQRMIDFKIKRKLQMKGVSSTGEVTDASVAEIVGRGWFRGFMRRNSKLIVSKQGQIKDLKRQSWCVYDKFEAMYDCVYEKMVEAKVAIKLDTPILYDKEGNEVTDPNMSFGLPSRYKITDPNRIIFVDETGKNTNMKTDGKVGGRRFIVPATSTAAPIGSTSDIHFTTLCFTSALGDPIMCAVIFKSQKKQCEIPITWKLGINITKDVLTGTTETETIMLNYGDEKAMSGGPRCMYNGKEIPCFTGCSPKASITSKLLADMMEALDKQACFDRSNGSKPFLLLDGHHSRLELSFLDYIVDPDHEWVVCIGVPYGTHLWQVGDSEAQNGSFSSAVAKAKEQIFRCKPDNNKNFCSTDIIPIINMAWQDSFFRSEASKRAIAVRGWNPLNYALLLHSDIMKTKPTCTITDVFTGNNNKRAINLIDEINTSRGPAKAAVDLMIINEMKNLGRTEAIRSKRIKKEESGERIKALASIGGKITSGMLAVNEHYAIDADVRDAIALHYKKLEEKDKAIRNRKRVRANAMITKYLLAKQQYTTGEKQLTKIELLSLIKYHHRPNDPPFNGTLVDLKQQWEIYKVRMETDAIPVIVNVDEMINEIVETRSADDESDLGETENGNFMSFPI